MGGYGFAVFAYFAYWAYAGWAALFALALSDQVFGAADQVIVHSVEGGALAYSSGVAVVEVDCGCG
jgi:hypothetical protein